MRDSAKAVSIKTEEWHTSSCLDRRDDDGPVSTVNQAADIGFLAPEPASVPCESKKAIKCTLTTEE